MTALDWNAVAEISAARIVDCLLAGTVISLFARLLLALGRRQSAGVRFAVWFSALMAVAALPMALPVMSRAWRWQEVATGGNPVLLLPASMALYLFAAWTAIAAVLLCRVGVGLFDVRALRKRCVTFSEDSLRFQWREILARQSGSRPVELCLSDEVQVPTAIGFFKPAVVLPRFLVNELSPADLNQVLLHELAHLRRYDDWTNLAQQIVKALLFFHPAVWWIERKISLAREMACDDAVLAETASPRAYAECLAHLAEKSFLRRSLALAQAAVGRIRHTSLRVAQILDVNRTAGKRQAWKPAVALVGAFAMLCAVGIARAPRLISFADRVSAPATNAPPLIASNNLPIAALVHKASWNPSSPARPGNTLKAGTKARSHSCATNRPEFQGTANASVPAASGVLLDAQTLVQPAALQAAPSSIPALFVVVEGYEVNSSGQSVYQISVWRITVRSTENHTGTAVPRKT